MFNKTNEMDELISEAKRLEEKISRNKIEHNKKKRSRNLVTIIIAVSEVLSFLIARYSESSRVIIIFAIACSIFFVLGLIHYYSSYCDVYDITDEIEQEEARLSLLYDRIGNMSIEQNSTEEDASSCRFPKGLAPIGKVVFQADIIATYDIANRETTVMCGNTSYDIGDSVYVD